MLKQLATDRDSQFGQMREIGLAQLARPVFLGKVQLLPRTLRGAPVFHVPPQRPQLPVSETFRVLALSAANIIFAPVRDSRSVAPAPPARRNISPVCALSNQKAPSRTFEARAKYDGST